MNTPIRMTVAALLLGASTVALARPPGPPSPEMMIERLATELQLSDAQKSSILEILQATAPDPQQRRPACVEGGDARATREVIDQEIAALLDDAQRERFEAMHADRPAPTRGGMRAPGDCT